MKLITKATAAKLKAAYEHSAETGESGKDCLVKFFTPWAEATCFISEGMPVDANGEPTEIDQAKDWHLFGFCDLGDAWNAELGYVMLSDLENIRGFAGLKIERDLYSKLPTMADVIKQYQDQREKAA